MSLWDIVAGISTSKQLNNDNKSFWKKFNSASVELINGDGLAFTNEGGFTWNIFGANVSFVCDLEALIEGGLASAIGDGHKWWQTAGHVGLGFLFGPGANNNIVIGNSLTLNYMVGHSKNFSVLRGYPESSISYSPWQDGALGPDESPITNTGKFARNRHKLMWLAIAGFALLVAGFDIALNVLKNKINGQEEIVHHDEAEKEKYKAIVEAEQHESEAHGQVVNPDAGGVPVEPTHAQEELEHARHQLETDEGTLNKTETSYEWTIFSSIIAENRAIWLLKFLEELCFGVKTVKVELKNITETVAKLAPAPNAIDEGNKASFQQEVENIKNIILQLETLAELPQLSLELLQDLWTQVVRANNLKNELDKKIKDYEDAARQSEQLLDVSIKSNASE